jgi:hypothetical protein
MPLRKVVQFRVRRLDATGPNHWAVTAPLWLKVLPETDSALSWTGDWADVTDTDAQGGSLRRLKTGEGDARATIEGRSFAWVGSMGPEHGSAVVGVQDDTQLPVALRDPVERMRLVLHDRRLTHPRGTRIRIRSDVQPAGMVDVDGLAVLGLPPTATVLVAGDIAGCHWKGDERTAALIAARPGLVMTAGDNVYPSGTLRQYRNCYAPSWGEFRGRTRPVPGNHDWLSGGSGYFTYYGSAAGPRNRGYYAFSTRTWRVYALTSDCSRVGGCGPGSAQYRWLKADLAANPQRCVMAVWHHPRFSSGEDGNNLRVAPLVKLLFEADADLVINGHSHAYERFAPARPNGQVDRERGIRQIVVGTGGAPLGEFEHPRPAHSEVRNRTTYGVLQLTLSWNRFAWEFLPVPGSRFHDQGQGSCH